MLDGIGGRHAGAPRGGDRMRGVAAIRTRATSRVCCQAGSDTVLKKIGEEATEVVMACKDGDPARIVAETADLWFHSMVAAVRAAAGRRAGRARAARGPVGARRGRRAQDDFLREKTHERRDRHADSQQSLKRSATSAIYCTCVFALGAVVPAGTLLGDRVVHRLFQARRAARTLQEPLPLAIRSFWSGLLVSSPLWVLLFLPGLRLWPDLALVSLPLHPRLVVLRGHADAVPAA